jgi:cytochrome c oxidase cbb3-type subunit 1
MSAESISADQRPLTLRASPAVAGAVWHSLVWLVVGNAIGIMIAILLLLPGLNPWLGEWTYGRWVMVHMNIALYGWCSLPMLGFLFKVYGAERGTMSAWCRPVLWLWSGALVVGSMSWLSGQSSGKLFLDWSGYARVFFPLAMGALWLVLLLAFIRKPYPDPEPAKGARLAKILGLVILAVVPVAIYFASSPFIYPAVNPDTGGPTGASQLESSLGIVLILLVLPMGITRRNQSPANFVALSWIVFLAEAALCALMNRADISHHRPTQYLSLASLLVWLPLIPSYYAAFQWHTAARKWRIAMFWWWGGLVVSGWVLFLPGVLDRVKFTDVLVGHSLTAVAGFLTALLIFAMIQMIGEEDAWIFNRTWSFHAWNMGVLAYVVIITIAGWIESANPAFTIMPGPARDSLYFLRLLTGIAMLLGSLEWLIAASALPGLARPVKVEFSGVNAA